MWNVCREVVCTYDKFELCKRVFANREKFAFNFLCEEKNLLILLWAKFVDIMRAMCVR